MGLPVLNDTPKYEMTIPSSSKKVRYRPYLVREEKILLLANESQDQNAIMSAITDTVLSCVQDNVERSELTTFDLEYMFVKIRSKSVGEKVEMYYACNHCEQENEVIIDLEEVKCEVNNQSQMIELTEDISLEIGYPSYDGIDIEANETDTGFSIIANSIKTVYTKEERIDMVDESKENIRAFLESMTSSQFKKVAEFVKEMPVVLIQDSFVCKSCGTENRVEIRGISDFF